MLLKLRDFLDELFRLIDSDCLQIVELGISQNKEHFEKDQNRDIQDQHIARNLTLESLDNSRKWVKILFFSQMLQLKNSDFTDSDTQNSNIKSLSARANSGNSDFANFQFIKFSHIMKILDQHKKFRGRVLQNYQALKLLEFNFKQHLERKLATSADEEDMLSYSDFLVILFAGSG